MSTDFSNISTLIIDTNSNMRQITVSMMRTMGIKKIIVANNENQCFDIIATEKINLIVCGWAPPRLDALSILKKVRALEKTMTIPFIILSTIIEQEQIKEAVLNGVSEYIVPPFNKMIFENKINKALKIPIKVTARNIAEKLSSQHMKPKSKKSELDILIVDDVADNIEIIRNLLKDDYHVKAAINATVAMKICLSSSPPDLILLDIMMPEIDGLTLCKELKKNPITQNIVVLFLSALSETKDVVKGLSLGAVDYITKPITPAILLARLDVHTTLIMNQRAIQAQIDNLIRQNSIKNKYNQAIQKDINQFLTLGFESINQLEKTKQHKEISPAISQLSLSLGMTNLIVENMLLLESLENNSYQVQKNKVTLKSTLLPIIDIFNSSIAEQNLERYEDISNSIYSFTDSVLLRVLFTCLYRNAIQAAPKGSRVSVEVKMIESFVLIKIHNIGKISEEVEKTFDQLFITSRPETGTGIGVYFAYLLVNHLKSNLYYHSSDRFGTTFYIKLLSL